MNLKAEINHRQRRLGKELLNTIAFAEDWDLSLSSGAFVDTEIANVAMARPLPLSSQWSVGPATGNYARFTLASYLTGGAYGITASEWMEDNYRFDGDKFIVSKGALNNPVYYGTAVGANQPYYVEFLSYNTGNQVFKQFSTGITRTLGDLDGSIRLDYWTNGKLLFYRNGTYVKTFHIEQEKASKALDRNKQSRQDSNRETYSSAGNTGTPKHSNKYIGLLIIPMANRGLLVFNTVGRGCLIHFDDIDYLDEDSYITSASSYLWWQVHSGQQKVQMAKCYFEQTCSLIASTNTFLQNPDRRQPQDIKVYCSYTGTGSRNTAEANITKKYVQPNSIDNLFVQNGVNYQGRIRIDFTNDGTYTPLIAAAECTMRPLEAYTSNEPYDITSKTTECTLDVPEDFNPAKVSFTCKEPYEIEQATGNLAITNKPIRLLAEHSSTKQVRIWAGRTQPISFKDNISDKTRRLVTPGIDATEALKNYIFDEPVILGKYYLDEAFEFLLDCIGHNLTDVQPMYNPTTGERINLTDSWAKRRNQSNFPDQHAFQYQIEVGDTAYEWMMRLFKDFIPDGMMCFRPTLIRGQYDYTFWVRPSWDLPTTTMKDIYVHDGKLKLDPRRKHPFHDICTYYGIIGTEIGCNRAGVMGLDYRTQQPIIAYKNDYSSQNVSATVAQRPDNWLGEVRKFHLGSDRLSTQTHVNEATKRLLERGSKHQLMCAFDCPNMLFDKDTDLPLWKGDVIKIAERALVRITSLKTNFQRANPDVGRNQGVWYSPTSYTGIILENLFSEYEEDRRGPV